MRDPRAVLAFVFGLVGAVLVLMSIPFLLPLFFGYGGFGYGFPFGLFGFLMTITSAALVIVGAVGTFVNPTRGVMWGTVMIVFGSTSAFGTGGLLVGLALAIAGGALAVVAGASEGPSLTFPVAGLRACTSCGMLFSKDFAFCPYCGHAVGGLKV